MTKQKFKVFYDGSCPICNREIIFYKKFDKLLSIDWVNVANVLSNEIVPGLSKETALKKFHIQSIDGQIIGGALAFPNLWLQLPPLKLLGRLSLHWPLKNCLPYFYSYFLILRPSVQKLMKSFLKLRKKNNHSMPNG